MVKAGVGGKRCTFLPSDVACTLFILRIQTD